MLPTAAVVLRVWSPPFFRPPRASRVWSGENLELAEMGGRQNDFGIILVVPKVVRLRHTQDSSLHADALRKKPERAHSVQRERQS